MVSYIINFNLGLAWSVHRALDGVVPIQTGNGGEISHPNNSPNNEQGRCPTTGAIESVYIYIFFV